MQSIVLALNNIQTTLPCRLLVCGGGAKNQAIMNGLKQALPNWRIQLTTELELDIDYVEAAALLGWPIVVCIIYPRICRV